MIKLNPIISKWPRWLRVSTFLIIFSVMMLIVVIVLVFDNIWDSLKYFCENITRDFRDNYRTFKQTFIEAVRIY
jgi:hypothetical protein